MKVRVTRGAARDLAEIVAYVKAHSPAGAKHVYEAIARSMAQLAEFPEVGRIQSAEGVRRIVTSRYGYLVYYTLDREADEVVIIAVQHPARERGFFDA